MGTTFALGLCPGASASVGNAAQVTLFKLIVNRLEQPADKLAWWNANVQLAPKPTLGLLTGQGSTDGVLNAIDAARKQGPS